MGNLGPDRNPSSNTTIGSLDLGGASVPWRESDRFSMKDGMGQHQGSNRFHAPEVDYSARIPLEAGPAAQCTEEHKVSAGQTCSGRSTPATSLLVLLPAFRSAGGLEMPLASTAAYLSSKSLEGCPQHC